MVPIHTIQSSNTHVKGIGTYKRACSCSTCSQEKKIKQHLPADINETRTTPRSHDQSWNWQSGMRPVNGLPCAWTRENRCTTYSHVLRWNTASKSLSLSSLSMSTWPSRLSKESLSEVVEWIQFCFDKELFISLRSCCLSCLPNIMFIWWTMSSRSWTSNKQGKTVLWALLVMNCSLAMSWFNSFSSRRWQTGQHGLETPRMYLMIYIVNISKGFKWVEINTMHLRLMIQIVENEDSKQKFTVYHPPKPFLFCELSSSLNSGVLDIKVMSLSQILVTIV